MNRPIGSPKYKAIVIGFKLGMSLHKIADNVHVSINTVKKYLKLTKLYPLSISEAMMNYHEYKRHNFIELEYFKEIIHDVCGIQNCGMITEKVSTCKLCGYTGKIELADQICPKCGMTKLACTDVITTIAPKGSIR
jgi:rubrerythrin